jgi:branched-chain amino acid transport system ATP-binding protein
MPDPLLLVTGVQAGYGRLPVLHGASLAVAAGEPVGLIGANGAGKTTLLRTISGITRRWSGRIEFDGQEIGKLPAEKIVRLGLAHVPQDRHVFPDLTVRENLLIGGSRGQRGERTGHAGDQAAYWLDRFPMLADRAQERAGVLSGGEQQILVICRALMARPKLLLLDEPSLGLAPAAQRSCFVLLDELRRQGMALLIVDDDLALLRTVARRIYRLRFGELDEISEPAAASGAQES